MKLITLFIVICLMIQDGGCGKTLLENKYVVFPGTSNFHQYSLNSEESYVIKRNDTAEKIQLIKMRSSSSNIFLFWVDGQNDDTVHLSKITSDSYKLDKSIFVTPGGGRITDLAVNEFFRYIYIASQEGLFELNLSNGSHILLSNSAVTLVKSNQLTNNVYFLSCHENGSNSFDISIYSGVYGSNDIASSPVDSCFTKWELDFENNIAFLADRNKLLRISLAELMSNSLANLEHLATYPGNINSLSLDKNTLYVSFQGDKKGYLTSFRFGLPDVPTAAVYGQETLWR